MKKEVAIIALGLLFSIFISWTWIDGGGNTDWSEYLGGADRNHYSTLTQINPENVKKLTVAWTYSVKDSGQIQANSLIVDGVLYGVSPTVQVFALDAKTGREIWTFGERLKHWSSTSRGVAFWRNKTEKRILFTSGANLWALNADTGKPISTFGDGGKIDLHTGLPEIAKNKFIISNTPGTIFENLILMPVRVSEGSDAAPGDIRAFDVISGKLVWTFHTIPYPGEYGYETFPKEAYKNTDVGAVNNWAGMAVDKQRGIVFVPTGSAAFDFYGGNRHGKNLFANCLLALDAKTGKRLWHYQLTHHDIWDRDLPAPPNLMTLTIGGKKIDVVAQVSKQGYVFVFERTTGKPIFPIREIPVEQSTLKGEKTWATQPIPQLPRAFARQSNTINAKQISPYAQNRQELVEELKQLKTSVYAPGTTKGTLMLPGFDGGAEWGGAAADPEGNLYVNANEMAWILKMVENPKSDMFNHLTLGERGYRTNCISCHGEDRRGNVKSNYPSLINIRKKYSRGELQQIVSNGKGMMPGFTTLSAEEKQAIISFLLEEEKQEVVNATQVSSKTILPYRTTGYNKFLDNRGLPAIAPPWGTLTAINLNTGQFKWQIPLGFEPILAKEGIMNTGVENYGGPVVTASGLLFIAATKDGMFRAFDKNTSKLLWETKLPAAAFATPSVYSVGGKQFVVVACGGTKLGTAKGNQYVAFSLP